MASSKPTVRNSFLKILAGVMILVIAFSAYQFMVARNYGTGAVETEQQVSGKQREIAFVSNGMSGTISLIDIANAKLVKSINIIPDGPKVGFFRDPSHALFGQSFIEAQAGLNYSQDTDVSPDGTVLYVARGHLGDVAAFDIASGQLMWRMPIPGVRADHMTVSPDGYTLYVSAMTANEVIAIDTRKGKRSGHFETGIWPHDNHVSHDGQFLFNASIGDLTEYSAENQPAAPAAGEPGQYQITQVRTDDLAVVDTFQFPSGVRPFQITKNDAQLFAQLSNTHSVIMYDLKSKSITNRIDLPIADGLTEDDWDFQAPHHGLDLSGDGEILCVAGRASDYAGLVRAADLSLITTVPVGNAPGWAEFDGTGNICLLANTRSDDVSLVAVDELREIARIPVDNGPKHITIAAVPDTALGLAR